MSVIQRTILRLWSIAVCTFLILHISPSFALSVNCGEEEIDSDYSQRIKFIVEHSEKDIALIKVVFPLAKSNFSIGDVYIAFFIPEIAEHAIASNKLVLLKNSDAYYASFSIAPSLLVSARVAGSATVGNSCEIRFEKIFILGAVDGGIKKQPATNVPD